MPNLRIDSYIPQDKTFLPILNEILVTFCTDFIQFSFSMYLVSSNLQVMFCGYRTGNS